MAPGLLRRLLRAARMGLREAERLRSDVGRVDELHGQEVGA